MLSTSHTRIEAWNVPSEPAKSPAESLRSGARNRSFHRAPPGDTSRSDSNCKLVRFIEPYRFGEKTAIFRIEPNNFAYTLGVLTPEQMHEIFERRDEQLSHKEKNESPRFARTFAAVFARGATVFCLVFCLACSLCVR